MIEHFRNFSEFISRQSQVSYNGRHLEFPVNESLTSPLVSSGAKIETSGNTCSLDLSLSIGDVLCFYDENDFIKRYKPAKNFQNLKICIFKSDIGFLFKSENESYDSKMRVVFNFHYYRMILNFLLQSTDFISVPIPAEQKFILFDKHGPIEIGYNPLEKRVAQLEELEPIFNRLTEMFEKYEFQEFFKSNILLSISKYDLRERFFKIVESLSFFIDQAEKEHKIYLKKFAFENIKSKFKKERTKYFESIEKNLDAINKQVTAFPLTFSATIFASYQVKEKPVVLFFIFIAYSLYTVVAWMVLNISNKNLLGIKKDVNEESDEIRKTDMNLFEIFKPDFDKVYAKLTQLFNLVLCLRLVLSFLLLMFLAFVLYQIVFVPKAIDVDFGKILINI